MFMNKAFVQFVYGLVQGSKLINLKEKFLFCCNKNN